MPSREAPRMSTSTRSKRLSSYLLRVIAGSRGSAGCRYELHELRTGEVRSFDSLAALQCHLGEAEAERAVMADGGEEHGEYPE